MASRRTTADELEGQAVTLNVSLDRLELEARWLEIIAYLTSAWLIIGGAGTGLAVAFTGSAWSFLCMLPCLAFAVVTWIQIGRVTSMIGRQDYIKIIKREGDGTDDTQP
jgi:hypothetical protein